MNTTIRNERQTPRPVVVARALAAAAGRTGSSGRYAQAAAGTSAITARMSWSATAPASPLPCDTHLAVQTKQFDTTRPTRLRRVT
jgi:hypothetical protein